MWKVEHLGKQFSKLATALKLISEVYSYSIRPAESIASLRTNSTRKPIAQRIADQLHQER